MNVEIELSCDVMGSDTLHKLVAEEMHSVIPTVGFELHKIGPRSVVGGLDTAILVAIVSGASATVSALIGGLLRILERRFSGDGKVVLKGADGTTLEFPANTSPEKVDILLKQVKSITVKSATLIVSPNAE